MDLKSGINVLFDDRISDVDTRLEFSRGTQSAKNIIQDGVNYCSTARIPVNDWTQISYNQLTCIYETSAINIEPGHWVKLIVIPDEITSHLKYIVSTATSTPEVKQHPQYYETVSHLVDQLRALHDGDDQSLAIHNIAYRPAGLITSTLDQHRDCMIGLHLDVWEQVKFGQTHTARPRIALNLGFEDRFLLFINLSIQQMFDMLNTSVEQLLKLHPHRNPSSAVGYEFMKCNPDYPITRLRVAPGEAYIAHTENMFHDGSTLGQTIRDITFMVRGFFHWDKSL